MSLRGRRVENNILLEGNFVEASVINIKMFETSKIRCSARSCCIRASVVVVVGASRRRRSSRVLGISCFLLVLSQVLFTISEWFCGGFLQGRKRVRRW